MLTTPLIALIAFSTSVSSHPLTPRSSQVTLDTLSASRTLSWSPCYDKFECARLDLPMDPDDPSDDLRVGIPLLKHPANLTATQNVTYSGMMLFNPGGPGSAGTTFLPFAAPILAEVIGPSWDIVAFDPRGVGFASPSVNCTNTSLFGDPQPSFSKRAAGLIAPDQIEQFYQEELKIAQYNGQQCNATIGANSSSIGHYVSTYYVAKDLMAIVDAYRNTSAAANASDPHMLNYYGLSYGTVIGQTVASLFPKRLGRMILDGVLDPYDYVSGKELKSIYLDDQIVEQFLRLCQLAGPEKCEFAHDTTTNLYPRFKALLKKLDPVEAAKNGWSNTSDISTALRLITSHVSDFAFYPISTFPAFGQILAEIEPIILTNFSLSALESALASSNGPITQSEPAMNARDEWEISILCSDSDYIYGQNVSVQDELLQLSINQSSIQGGDNYATHAIQCAGWPIKAHKRYAGPFGSNCTAHGIQFLGITLDYATPLANALQSASQYNNAKVIAIDSVGHTAITSQSTCGVKAIQQYLATGEPVELFCPLELVPFNVTGLTEYGWIKSGQLVSNETRVYTDAEGNGPLISETFNLTDSNL